MPKKLKKFGIKVWTYCQSDTRYCLQFEMYTKNAEGGNAKHGLSYRVVMSLMELYLKKGYNLYMDSFYTNLAFFRALLDRQTYACGTIK